SLVQAGKGQHDGPPRLTAADRPEMLQHVFQGVVQDLGGDHHHVRLGVEAFEVLVRVVARFVHAAGVQEGQQRGLGRGKLIRARKTRTRLEALTNLGLAGAGQELDDRRLAALRLAVQPEDWHGRLRAQLVEPFLQFGIAGPRLEPGSDRVKHGLPAPASEKHLAQFYCTRWGPREGPCAPRPSPARGTAGAGAFGLTPLPNSAMPRPLARRTARVGVAADRSNGAGEDGMEGSYPSKLRVWEGSVSAIVPTGASAAGLSLTAWPAVAGPHTPSEFARR